MTELEKAYQEVKEQCDYIRKTANAKPHSKSAAVVKSFDIALDALRERMEREGVTDINVGSKWISVEDRLPEIGIDKTLVALNTGYVTIGTWNGQGNRWMGAAVQSWEHVTHWQPLPKPPKMGAKGV